MRQPSFRPAATVLTVANTEKTTASIKAFGLPLLALRDDRPKKLFCSLYTDRGSPHFHTPEASGKGAPGVRTQVGRMLAQLGVERFDVYSPEARGRSERMFRALQVRQPKELSLAGIADDLDAANRFIREVYPPALNARFAVAPAEAGEGDAEPGILSAASPAFAPEQACGRRGRAILAHPAHTGQQKRKLSIYVVHKPVNFTCSQQPWNFIGKRTQSRAFSGIEPLSMPRFKPRR